MWEELLCSCSRVCISQQLRALMCERLFFSRAISGRICKPAETKFWANPGGFQGSFGTGRGRWWGLLVLSKAGKGKGKPRGMRESGRSTWGEVQANLQLTQAVSSPTKSFIIICAEHHFRINTILL